MKGRWSLVLAFLLGIAVALPAGVMLAGDDTDPDAARSRATTADRRDFYSPSFVDDPYFVEQQRRNVAALEAHCEDTGESCAEARAAQRWLEEHSG